MTDSEREILREREDLGLGQRKPWDSSRQATYEDSVPPPPDWDDHESD